MTVEQQVDQSGNGPRSGLLANFSVLAASQLATWGLTLIWTLFVPRALGPAATGLIVMALSTQSLLMVLGGLSSRTLVTKRVAASPEEAPTLLGTSLALRAASAIPAAILLFLYIKVGHFSGPIVAVLLMGCAMALCTLLLDPLQAIFQAFERMQYLAYAEVANKLLVSVSGIVLVLFGFGATTLVGGMLAAAICSLLLSAWWVRRFVTVDWHITFARARALLVESLGYWAFLIFYVLYLWLDTILLTLMTPTAVVGWYGLPTRLFGSLLVFPVLMGTTWLPRMAAAFAADPARLKDVARVPLELVSVAILPVAAGGALVAKPILELLYGPAFAPAAPVFAILAITTLPMSVNIIVYQVLVASNRNSVWTKTLAGATVINLALNIVLISYFQKRVGNGAIGAAISLFLTEVVVASLGLVLMRDFLDRRSALRVGRAALATLVMASMVAVAAPRGLAVQVAAGTAVFLVLAWVLRLLDESEARAVLETADRFRRRVVVRVLKRNGFQ